MGWSLAPVMEAQEGQAEEKRPNILLISIDDLNDWVGHLGGHPQAKTPHIDRLAEQGTSFANAHCQSPVCNPSRASLMLSRYPSSTGIYFLNPELLDEDAFAEKPGMTLPERMKEEGYAITAGGKLFHGRDNPHFFASLGVYGGQFGSFGPYPEEKISQPFGHRLWDWGAFPDEDESMPDARLARWTKAQLAEEQTEPFFLAVGFYRPHVPMYVPQKWFDLHPRESVKTPMVYLDDLDDISKYARDLTRLEHVAPTQGWVRGSGEWEHAVQAYLACTSFVDHYVGEVLAALESSPYAANTIVILFSDHGFHLGEKERWAKRSLWEDGTRVPLIISGSGLPKGQHSQKPVGLIDLYPTILDLIGADPDPRLEGQSLVPLLYDPARSWDRPVLTNYGPGNHAVRSERWRYIRYNDGSEELYDHNNDPHEWHNLASLPEYRTILSEHAQWIPVEEKPILGRNSTGHNAYTAAEGNRRP